MDMKKGGLMDGAGSEWYENDHPRDESGKFTDKGGNGIKEQVRLSLDKLKNKESLMNITNLNSDYLDLVKQVQTDLNKTNGFVSREGFGEIQVGAKLNEGLKYFRNNALTKTAVLSVPAVLEKGIVIGEHANHKGRDYGTITFAGKVSFAGDDGIVAVVVKQTTGNFYKVHRVIMPNGDALE